MQHEALIYRSFSDMRRL